MRVARTRRRVARRRTCMYRGVIIADRKDTAGAELLSSLGIEWERYSASANGYIDCAVPEEALIKLDPYWGRFYWSLFPDDE